MSQINMMTIGFRRSFDSSRLLKDRFARLTGLGEGSHEVKTHHAECLKEFFLERKITSYALLFYYATSLRWMPSSNLESSCLSHFNAYMMNYLKSTHALMPVQKQYQVAGCILSILLGGLYDGMPLSIVWLENGEKKTYSCTLVNNNEGEQHSTRWNVKSVEFEGEYQFDPLQDEWFIEPHIFSV